MTTTPRYGVAHVDSTDPVATAMLTKLNNAMDSFDVAVKPSELVTTNIPDFTTAVLNLTQNNAPVWG